MTTATAQNVDSKVRQVVSNIRNLPTPPMVFHQIQKVINDPNVSAAQIASILQEDPAMSVKVLKLTNSAFYGLAREVESVKHAVVIVGLEAIKNLVLAASVLDMFKGDNIDQEYQDQFWRHSLAVASCGRVLARKVKSRGMVDPDSAFSAGLLHDIGKLVISCFLTEEHKKIVEARATDHESPDHELEQKVLGYDHAQVGSLLAERWKLPHRLREAITYHHDPMSNQSGDPIAHLIHLCNYVAKSTYEQDNDAKYVSSTLQQEVAEYLGVDETSIAEYTEILREEFLKAETFMQMAGLNR